MIYVISKATFGDYRVRDIQCNANWCSCPYSNYALIPDYLVDAILATKGYCDITLNSAGTEVVAFTARSVPRVPVECCGTNTVLSVNGVKADTWGNVELSIEAKDGKGINLVDVTTGENYRIYISNGQLMVSQGFIVDLTIDPTVLFEVNGLVFKNHDTFIVSPGERLEINLTFTGDEPIREMLADVQSEDLSYVDYNFEYDYTVDEMTKATLVIPCVPGNISIYVHEGEPWPGDPDVPLPDGEGGA